jgi:hypothetical protein
VNDGADEEKTLGHIGMGECEIEGESASGGVANDDGAVHFDEAHQLKEIVLGSEWGGGGIRAAVATAVIAHYVVLGAERRPDVLRDDGVNETVVEKDDADGAAGLQSS